MSAAAGISQNAFFFQAEDGIRYFHVTGVQTCALPIYPTQIRRVGHFSNPIAPDLRTEDPRHGVVVPPHRNEGVVGTFARWSLRHRERVNDVGPERRELGRLDEMLEHCIPVTWQPGRAQGCLERGPMVGLKGHARRGRPRCEAVGSSLIAMPRLCATPLSPPTQNVTRSDRSSSWEIG